MSAIAQRRVAGATALMILLYLLQVALFAAPAEAGIETAGGGDGICPQNEDGWSSHLSDDPTTESGLWGSISMTTSGSEESESLDAEINAGYTIEVCVKQGSGYTIYSVFNDDPDGLPQIENVHSGDLSHWGWRLINVPDTPEFTIGLCDDELRPVTFTVQPGFEVAIWEKETNVLVGSFLGGQHSIDLAPGAYSWIFYQLMGEDKTQLDQGSFTVPPCDTTTSSSTTSSSTTSSTTSTTSTTSTSTTTTTQPTTSTSEETTTTTTTEPDDEEVLGTTITTVPEVSADTLPFTGSESGELFKLAMLALAAGALMLFAVRGPKEEDEVATEIGGWSSL